MAKKKSKKSEQKRIVFSALIIFLSLLTLCTVFMPAFSSKIETILGNSNTTNTSGLDVLSACFNDSVSTNLSSGTNSLVLLKKSDDYAFITNVFCWGYFVTVIASGIALLFALLSLLKIRIKPLSLFFGAILVLSALVTFIFGLIVAGKFSQSGTFAGYKTTASVCVYFLWFGVVCGITQIISAKK